MVSLPLSTLIVYVPEFSHPGPPAITNVEYLPSEQVSLKSDGRYSTLVIAGGPGWENSGAYTIKVDNGKETKSNTFSFTI